MTYDEYIRSTAWDDRRQRYWDSHPERSCRACGTTAGIQLHHVRYDPSRFGSEPDDDLLPLCGAHHDEVHEIHDENSAEITLLEATARVVAVHGGLALPTGEPMSPPRNTDQWRVDVSVACPDENCQAPPNQPCVKVSSHGRRQTIRGVHRARKAAARKAKA